MATKWVVDASIAVKLLLAEPDSEQVRDLIDQAILSSQLIAPFLLRYEVGNAVCKRGLAPIVESMAAKALAPIHRLEPLDIAPFVGPLSYYDASYLALAIEQKAGLLSADEKMRKAAKKHGIEVGP